MELSAVGLKEQPFRTHGKPLVFVPCAGQQAALDFLDVTYQNPQGLGLFFGPPLSGKTTVFRRFVENMDPDVSTAIVDGSGLNTTALLEAVLGQFGYRLEYNSANELINMLKVFTMQQAASGKPPLLIIEHTHAMNASALRVLCELANIKVRHASALRMVLASDRSIQTIIDAPAMGCISDRLTGEFHLDPIAHSEMADYLYAKLQAAGSDDPAHIMPRMVCYELHRASGGWPGIIDRLALLALAKATGSPIKKEWIEHPVLPEKTSASSLLPLLTESRSADYSVAKANEAEFPKLILTLNGESIDELVLDDPRALVGRSEHNEVCIDSRFISRHHAMFIRHGTVTFLMDLNSTNGTFVNSRQISNHVMMHDDVVSLGNYSIKFVYPSATFGGAADSVQLDDTVIMKSLDDMRRMLAQENTHTMPVVDDQPKASGDTDS
jgi:general secretion pathway protein A